MMQGIWPKEVGVDTVDMGDLPDTAPEGPWTVNGRFGHLIDGPDEAWIECFVGGGTVAPDLARRVAAALNGAPATPAERAVIDAALALAADGVWIGTRFTATLVPILIDAVIRLRSERNKP